MPNSAQPRLWNKNMILVNTANYIYGAIFPSIPSSNYMRLSQSSKVNDQWQVHIIDNNNTWKHTTTMNHLLQNTWIN